MTNLTRAELENLKRLASETAPGPWVVGYRDGSGKYNEEDNSFCITDADGNGVIHAQDFTIEKDTVDKFISAANPAVITALVTRLIEAEDALQLCRNLVRDVQTPGNLIAIAVENTGREYFQKHEVSE